MNPLRQVPVLEDDGHVVRDSQAILVYLAGTYGGWWPDLAGRPRSCSGCPSPPTRCSTACAARLVEKFGYPLDKEAALAKAPAVLAPRCASGNERLAGDGATYHRRLRGLPLRGAGAGGQRRPRPLWQRGALDDPSGKPAGPAAALTCLQAGSCPSAFRKSTKARSEAARGGGRGSRGRPSKDCHQSSRGWASGAHRPAARG